MADEHAAPESEPRWTHIGLFVTHVAPVCIGSVNHVAAGRVKYGEGMPPPVAMSAMIQCSFGVAPGTLMVIPTSRVMIEKKPAANIMDHKPFVNILPFGVCSSLANPTTAAATAAALGVLTPTPCLPNTVAPWTPGASKTMIGGMPALTADSKCQCIWGGQISIVQPGTMKEQVK